MGEGTQKLTLEAAAKGFDKAAGDVAKVSGATEGLKDQSEASAAQTTKAAEATDKLNASESDYIELLRRTNPLLGELADGLLKGTRIAGDLASRNIDLKGTFSKLTAAVKGNVAALKLIGAGGAVVASVLAIAHALKVMREEAERVKEELAGIIEAQTKLRAEQAGRAQTIESMRDTMRAEPFTAEQARAAAQTAEDIRGKPRYAFLDEGAVAQAVAAVGGRADTPGGGERTIEEIAKLAQLLQSGKLTIDPGQRAESIGRAVDRALDRHAETLSAIFEREAQQAEERVSQARQEATAIGGALNALEALAKRRTEGTGAEPRDVAQLIQVLPDVLDRLAARSFATTEAERERFKERVSPALIRQEIGRLFRKGEIAIGPQALSDEEIRIARQVLPDLTRDLRQATAAMETAAEALQDLADRPQTTTIQNHHAKFVGPDAASRHKRTRNGETVWRQAAGGY
jgi:hypothetical protein